MIGEYFGELERRLGSFPLAVAVELRTERVDLDRGYVKAEVAFTDGSQLHLFEYVVLEDGEVDREDYRYHYQTDDGRLIRRWDNAPHHPSVDTFPHHVHVGDSVEASRPVSLEEVLGEVARHLRSEGADKR